MRYALSNELLEIKSGILLETIENIQGNAKIVMSMKVNERHMSSS